MRFTGRKVLVTGAGSNGMGRAIATRFSEEGADLVIHYHSNPQAAAELIAETEHRGHRAIALHAELRSPAAGRQLVRQAAERLGGLDVVVLTAAMVLRKASFETTDQEWADIFAVNLHGTFAVASEAAKIMLENGSGGRIVMIGSVLQTLASPNRAAYSATKAGLLQLARSMALELAPSGVTVNVIAPGTIITDMNRSLHSDPDVAKERLRAIPMARFGQPGDIAETAMFLASEGAGYITGNAIYVDGGMVLP